MGSGGGHRDRADPPSGRRHHGGVARQASAFTCMLNDWACVVW